jgi:hypothetical protein
MTLRKFMEANHGKLVSTVQTSEDGRVWMPGAREVDASRATYVLLDGSHRSYAGCTVLAHGEGTMTVLDTQMKTTIEYAVVA